MGVEYHAEGSAQQSKHGFENVGWVCGAELGCACAWVRSVCAGVGGGRGIRSWRSVTYIIDRIRIL